MTKEKNISRAFLGNVGISFFGYGAFGLINYFTRRHLAFNLNEVDYGFFYSTFSFVCVFLSLIDLGLGDSATVLISKYLTLTDDQKVKSVYSLILLGKGVLGVGIAVVLGLLAPWLISYYFGYENGILPFFLLCLFIPFSAMNGGVVGALEGKKDFLARNVLQLLQYGSILLVVLVGTKAWGINAPASGAVAGNLAAFALGCLYLFKRHSIGFRFRLKMFASVASETWRFSRWMAISVSGLCIMGAMDTQMLTVLTSLREVAFYNVALPIVQILLIFIIVPAVLTPTVSELWHRQQISRIGDAIINMIMVMLWIGGGILIGMILLSKHLIAVLFSTKFLGVSTALTILSCQIPFLVAGQFCLNTMNVMEKPQWAAAIVMGGLIVNALTNYLLIPKMGISGAALATVLSYLLICLSSIFVLSRLIKLAVSLWRIAILFAVAGLAGWGAQELWGDCQSFWESALYTVVALTAYSTASLPVIYKEVVWGFRSLQR